MAPSHITVRRTDRVQIIEIDRADKKNALTAAMYADLSAALDQAAADPSVRVAVIAGAAMDFTAGNDLNDFLDRPPTGMDSPVFQFICRLPAFEKPLIAAVEGVAVGIGTTLLLRCDFVHAAESARFVLPFVNLGLVPEAASSMLLARVVGARRAAEMLMLGDPFDAETARACGIVTDLCPTGSARNRALETARKLAQKPPAALRATEALMGRAGEPEAARIAAECQVFLECLASPEAKEAFAAFLEKRKPDFSKF